MKSRERLNRILVHAAMLYDERPGNPAGALAALKCLRAGQDDAAIRALQNSAVPNIAALTDELLAILKREVERPNDSDHDANEAQRG